MLLESTVIKQNQSVMTSRLKESLAQEMKSVDGSLDVLKILTALLKPVKTGEQFQTASK